MRFRSDYSTNIYGLIDEIKRVAIKNSNKKYTKTPKFTQLMDFPKCDFIFEAIATKCFFGNICRIVNVKTYLHHSHVTGKNYGYAHDFCDWKVRENQLKFSCIVHNYFGFNFISCLKV